jgi:CBS domain containing-hemolysin-like protein
MKLQLPASTRAIALALLFFGVVPCSAAAGSSEFVDKAASFLAIFIIITLPIGGVWLFWLVHILPEKIAEKNHHPQKKAIHTLCLLSLLFGGMLWPLAWLWAASKPVMYKMAYGRDKHDDYYAELEGKGESTAESRAVHDELGQLRQELDALEKRGQLPEAMQAIRERLARLASQAAPEQPVEGTR